MRHEVAGCPGIPREAAPSVNSTPWSGSPNPSHPSPAHHCLAQHDRLFHVEIRYLVSHATSRDGTCIVCILPRRLASMLIPTLCTRGSQHPTQHRLLRASRHVYLRNDCLLLLGQTHRGTGASAISSVVHGDEACAETVIYLGKTTLKHEFSRSCARLKRWTADGPPDPVDPDACIMASNVSAQATEPEDRCGWCMML